MPLIKFEKKTDYAYGIWKITESVKNLYNQISLNNSEKNYIEKNYNNLRKKQSSAAKLILNKLANKKVHVSYNKYGAPIALAFKNISISHSHKFSMALISEKPIGIDIQLRSKKINIIQSKFINQNDINECFELDQLPALQRVILSNNRVSHLEAISCLFRSKTLTEIRYKQPMARGFAGDRHTAKNPQWFDAPPDSVIKVVSNMICSLASGDKSEKSVKCC